MRPWRSVWSAPSWIAYISLVTALHERVRFGSTEWDDESWTIRSTLLDPGHYQSRMSLGNGYLGINVASTGPFFEVDHGSAEDSYNGWPLFNKRQTFASIAGFYTNQEPAAGTNFPWLEQYGKESFLAGIPHWSGLVVEADGHFLNSSVPTDEVSHYSAKLDISAGLLSWEYTWVPLEGIEIGVEYSMLVHKLYVNQAAVRLGLKTSRDINVTVHDVIEGNSAGRSNFVEKKYETTAEFPTIWTAVTPTGVDVIAYVYSVLNGNEYVDLKSQSLVPDGILGDSHDASIAQSVVVQLLSGKPAVVEKSVGIASADAFDDPQSAARHAAITGAKLGWAHQLRSHAGEWASILTKDSVDSYRDLRGHLPKDTRLQELQVISITIPFMILQHTVGPNAISAAGNNSRLNIHSIPVCGWASDCYGGLVFWDAETWMAMGLQASHPKHIETVINYRVEKYPQARENVKTAFTSSKNQTGRFTWGHGAVYPWTSARYGNCTGTGPCFDYEYHVNGDIANTFRNQLAITGDAQYFNDTLLPITNDLVYFLSEVLDFNTTSGYYELWNATDPDEYANNVNNVGFGTALIQSLFRETNELNAMFGRETNKTWNMMSKKMRLPVDEEVGIILEYEGQNGSISVKQADVVLIDDLLHYENPYSLANLDYYANKQSIDGPGMTYAAFSVVANEISPSGCSSYTYDAYSSQPWLRAPWFQFSEQLLDNYLINGGTHPAFPFLTGMGGANRIAIFGYLGLRLFVDRLDINPSLPPQIEHINYRTFYWQGYGINATSNSTHTTLARLPTHILPTADKKYCSSPIPVTLGTRSGRYWLGTEPIVVPNRMIGHKATVKNNALQCKPIVPANYAYQPGQFPIAAIDGAASTKWQPQDSTHTNYLSVDLGAKTSFYPLRSVLFDWGSMPPAYYEVLFTNVSLPPFNAHSDVRNVTAGYVDISEPYDPKLVDVILPVKGNQTNVTLAAGQWSGRYAHLGIRGNLWGEDVQVGATVAEWSVVTGADGVGVKWQVQAGY